MLKTNELPSPSKTHSSSNGSSAKYDVTVAIRAAVTVVGAAANSPPATAAPALSSTPGLNAPAIAPPLKSALENACESPEGTSLRVTKMMSNLKFQNEVLTPPEDDLRRQFMSILLLTGDSFPISKESIELFEKQIKKEKKFTRQRDTHEELLIEPSCTPPCINRKAFLTLRCAAMAASAIVAIITFALDTRGPTGPNAERGSVIAGYAAAALIGTGATILSFINGESKGNSDRASRIAKENLESLGINIRQLIKLELDGFKQIAARFIQDYVENTDYLLLGATPEEREALHQKYPDEANELDRHEAHHLLMKGVINHFWENSFGVLKQKITNIVGKVERSEKLTQCLSDAIQIFNSEDFEKPSNNSVTFVSNSMKATLMEMRADQRPHIEKLRQMIRELPKNNEKKVASTRSIGHGSKQQAMERKQKANEMNKRRERIARELGELRGAPPRKASRNTAVAHLSIKTSSTSSASSPSAKTPGSSIGQKVLPKTPTLGKQGNASGPGMFTRARTHVPAAATASRTRSPS